MLECYNGEGCKNKDKSSTKVTNWARWRTLNLGKKEAPEKRRRSKRMEIYTGADCRLNKSINVCLPSFACPLFHLSHVVSEASISLVCLSSYRSLL